MLICLPFFLEVGRLSQGAWGTKGRTVFARRDWCCVLCALLLPGPTQVNRHVPSVRFFGGGFLSHPTDVKRYSFSEKKLAFYSCVLAFPLLSCAPFLRLELWCGLCVVSRLDGEREALNSWIQLNHLLDYQLLITRKVSGKTFKYMRVREKCLKTQKNAREEMNKAKRNEQSLQDWL